MKKYLAAGANSVFLDVTDLVLGFTKVKLCSEGMHNHSSFGWQKLTLSFLRSSESSITVSATDCSRGPNCCLVNCLTEQGSWACGLGGLASLITSLSHCQVALCRFSVGFGLGGDFLRILKNELSEETSNSDWSPLTFTIGILPTKGLLADDMCDFENPPDNATRFNDNCVHCFFRLIWFCFDSLRDCTGLMKLLGAGIDLCEERDSGRFFADWYRCLESYASCRDGNICICSLVY
jgi:hypothetical protein